eukprot:323801-Chlamydomonas_euryale.AAC.2
MQAGGGAVHANLNCALVRPRSLQEGYETGWGGGGRRLCMPTSDGAVVRPPALLSRATADADSSASRRSDIAREPQARRPFPPPPAVLRPLPPPPPAMLRPLPPPPPAPGAV